MAQFMYIPSFAGDVVGLEETFYSVMEGVGVARVCARVFTQDINISCPISFPFNVSISTGNISAGLLPTIILACVYLTIILT